MVHRRLCGRDGFKQSGRRWKRVDIAAFQTCEDDVKPEKSEDPLNEFNSLVLRPEVADTRLSYLRMRGILSRMNSILGLNHVLSPAMKTLLSFCLSTCRDFGQAYALLRPRWHMHPSVALENVKACRNEHEFRSHTLASDFLFPPARVWDLWSNRVVPSWMVWVDFEECKWIYVRRLAPKTWMDANPYREIVSPINNYERRIHIPLNTTLEEIRVESLKFLAEHNIIANLAWIDILCERQADFTTSTGSHLEGPLPTSLRCRCQVRREMLVITALEVLTNKSYALLPQAADTALSSLGMNGILCWMNAIFSTDRDLSPGMRKLLYFCLRTFSDFGYAYAFLHPRWHLDPSLALKDIIKCCSENKAPELSSCLPKQLWDLWSNRVVPFRVVAIDQFIDLLNDEHRARKWTAVYHRRVDKLRQQNTTSPINGHEWPIPVPINTSLEQIRIDLLQVGTQCNIKPAWIDILCQRQEPEGTSSEEVFSETDVPTKWLVYSRAEWITFYLNGLSSPFQVYRFVSLRGPQPGYLDLDSSYDDSLKESMYWARRCTTIYSSVNEAEQGRLEVECQKSFTGPSYILSSELADTPLSNLRMQDILSRMNEILETDRILSASMCRLLTFCLCNFIDFGQAYSLLRPRWHKAPFSALANVEIRRKEDWKLRSEALENDIVVKPRIPPRRVWDIWSNRVMPFWVVEVGEICERVSKAFFPARRNWLAISHSWMHNNHRHNVDSPINGHEWPIPIPVDSSLERIRVELLNLAADHEIHIVWLDVLCLRQKGVASKEGLRRAEWKLDVPTIGPIYEHAERTVYYFSGLGRPFTAPTDKNDSRHWMNRAWTLQETRPKIIIAGRSSSSPEIPYAADLEKPFLPFLLDDRDKWQKSINNSSDVMKALMTPFIEHDRDSVWQALRLMRHRTGTSELDKIAGLVYRLNGFEPPLPAYIVGETIEDAWDRLIKATHSSLRAQLFFGFPEPGKGRHVWYPSWQQITDSSMIPPSTETWGQKLDFDESSNEYIITRCYCIEDCLVDGLSEVQMGGGGGRDGSSTQRREGRVHVVDKEGVKHGISITANVETTVADGQYTLVCPDDVFGFSEEWVVARKTRQGHIGKVAVIRVKGRNDKNAMEKVGKSFGKSTVRLA